MSILERDAIGSPLLCRKSLWIHNFYHIRATSPISSSVVKCIECSAERMWHQKRQSAIDRHTDGQRTASLALCTIIRIGIWNKFSTDIKYNRRKKGRDLTQSHDKTLSDNTKRHKKGSITQRLRTDFGLSVGVTRFYFISYFICNT